MAAKAGGRAAADPMVPGRVRPSTSIGIFRRPFLKGFAMGRFHQTEIAKRQGHCRWSKRNCASPGARCRRRSPARGNKNQSLDGQPERLLVLEHDRQRQLGQTGGKTKQGPAPVDALTVKYRFCGRPILLGELKEMRAGRQAPAPSAPPRGIGPARRLTAPCAPAPSRGRAPRPRPACRSTAAAPGAGPGRAGARKAPTSRSVT